jgi:hypothetical protein
MQQPNRFFGAALFVASCFTLTGCGESGPDLIPATGIVNYQGKPLSGAKVTFIPANKGSIAMATTDTDGSFELRTGTSPGVVEDSCAVTVTLVDTSIKSGLSKDMTPEDMQRLQMEGKLQGMLAKQQKSLIPSKYTKSDTSGLNYDVKKGAENKFTIELVD